jgi:hypothetical protein
MYIMYLHVVKLCQVFRVFFSIIQFWYVVLGGVFNLLPGFV